MYEFSYVISADWLDNSGFDPLQGQEIFLFSKMTRAALVPTQLRSRGANRPGREADHSSQPNAKVKNEWSCTFTSILCVHGINQGKFAFCLCSSIKINRSIILRVVLYGRETWLLEWWEESSLKVFENRVQRRVFGPKMHEVEGEWRRLHNELNDLYSSPIVIWVIESGWAGLWHLWGEEKCI